MQHVKAGSARHVQIEQQQARERILVAIRKGALSRQIINGLLTVFDVNERILNRGKFPDVVHEKYIIRVVFSVKYWLHSRTDCIVQRRESRRNPLGKAEARGSKSEIPQNEDEGRNPKADEKMQDWPDA